MRCKQVAIAAGLAAAVTAGFPDAAAAGQGGADPRVTFTKDIAPIFQRSCENCHRPAGGAPMSLVTYEEVRPWARSIKNRTGSREMPPWFVDKNIGIQDYKDDPSLSDEEIALIGAWVDAGAPRGNPGDLPPPLAWPADGWTYGMPDLIVPSPEGTIEADAADWFGEWGETPTGLGEDRYIKAIEVQEVRTWEDTSAAVSDDGRAALGLSVVHHAVLGADTIENTVAPLDCGNETTCAADDSEFWLVHELGQNPTIYPDEVGVKLPADSVITFNSMHLHSIGREVQLSDQPLLNEIQERMAKDGYRFSVAVDMIVQSRQFREIRGREMQVAQTPGTKSSAVR
jgi:mono/diheme cytochrome c family protein